MSRQALPMTLLMLMGCSGESFDPGAAALTGAWLLSSETTVNAVPGGGGVTSNGCTMRNVPVILEATSTPTLWVGATEDGGTLQCELNGQVGAVVPHNPGLFLQVTKTGGDLSLGLPNGLVVYTGKLLADDRMAGAVTGELDGQVGTWTARRN